MCLTGAVTLSAGGVEGTAAVERRGRPRAWRRADPDARRSRPSSSCFVRSPQVILTLTTGTAYLLKREQGEDDVEDRRTAESGSAGARSARIRRRRHRDAGRRTRLWERRPEPFRARRPLGEPDPTRPDTRETATEEINRRKGDQPNHGLLSDYDEGRPAPSLGSID